MRNPITITLVGLAAVCLGACAQSPTGTPDAGRATGTPDATGTRAPVVNRDPNRTTGRTPAGSGSPRMRQAWGLLGQWDTAQASGNMQLAQKLEGDIRGVVDPGFGEFQSAATGTQGVELQYLATSLLGFSANPQATPILVKQLDSNDASLVANALVALNLRKDPSTDLRPVLKWVDPRAPKLPKRYAPLVVASVLDAQARAGRRDTRMEGEAFRRVGQIAADRDGYTRLHVARALATMNNPGKTDYLLQLVQDDQTRVRWAAAAALQRSADPRGFMPVVRLLHDTPAGSKHIIQDILVSYRESITRTQMSEQQITALGTNAADWSRWFAEYQRQTGLRVTRTSG